jgi:phage gp36-like protein
MANPLAVTLHASGAETTSGSSAAVDLAPEVAAGGPVRAHARVTLDVTAVAGTTKAMVVTLETSNHSAGPWVAVGAFSSLGATAVVEQSFAACRRYVRVSWAITGTGGPGFTFEATATGNVLYAVPADLPRFGIPAAAISDLTESQKADGLLGATDFVATYVARAYTMPLKSWASDLVRATCHVAAYDLACSLGFSPEQYDANIRQRYTDLIGEPGKSNGWLDGLAAGDVALTGAVDSSATADEDSGAAVYTEPLRGW